VANEPLDNADDNQRQSSNDNRDKRVIYFPRDIAVLLDCSVATVYRRIDDKSIPTKRLGSGRLYIPKALFNRMFGLD
jgi:hypothetical protein